METIRWGKLFCVVRGKTFPTSVTCPFFCVAVVLIGFRPEAAEQLDSETRTDPDLPSSLQLSDRRICGGLRQQGRLLSHCSCGMMKRSTWAFYEKDSRLQQGCGAALTHCQIEIAKKNQSVCYSDLTFSPFYIIYNLSTKFTEKAVIEMFTSFSHQPGLY